MVLLGAEGLLLFVLLGFWIWAIFDCISTDSSLCRNLPKLVWLLLIIFLSTIGSLAWLMLGRPQKAGWKPGSTDYSAPRRPMGVEDQPGYSATREISDRRSAELDGQLEAWEREQERRKREAGEP